MSDHPMTTPTDLPPLPEADFHDSGDEFGYERTYGYTADQMREYGAACARAAVLAERERAANAATEKAARVLAANTSRGRVNSTGSFAAGILEDLPAAIRAG